MAGNSWQSPVTGEPSVGTWHTHIETIVNAVDPADATDQTVTVTNAPTGAKMIAGYAEVGSAATGNRFLTIKDMAGNAWTIIQMVNTTAVPGRGWFEVPIDGSKQFKWAASNGDVNLVNIFMRKYSS